MTKPSLLIGRLSYLLEFMLICQYRNALEVSVELKLIGLKRQRLQEMSGKKCASAYKRESPTTFSVNTISCCIALHN